MLQVYLFNNVEKNIRNLKQGILLKLISATDQTSDIQLVSSKEVLGIEAD